MQTPTPLTTPVIGGETLLLETLSHAQPIDMNNPYTFLNEFLEKNQHTLQKNTSFCMNGGMNVKVEAFLNNILKECTVLPFQFLIVSFEYEERVLFNFIEELMTCNFQLFYKFACYFKSPRRVNDDNNQCLMLGKSLVVLREYCQKINDNSESLVTMKSRERLEWINTLINEFGKSTKNRKTFKFELNYSIDNLVFVQDDILMMGLECSDCYSDESMKQLLFTFPSMYSQSKKHSEQDIPSTFICFTFDSERMLLNYGSVSKTNRLVIFQCFRDIEFTIQGMVTAYSIIWNHIQSDSKRKSLNISREAYQYASFKDDKKEPIESLYKKIFDRMSIKRTKKTMPTENHKKRVKERSLSILKDISNIPVYSKGINQPTRKKSNKVIE